MERKKKKEELIVRIFNAESNMSLFACAHIYQTYCWFAEIRQVIARRSRNISKKKREEPCVVFSSLGE